MRYGPGGPDERGADASASGESNISVTSCRLRLNCRSCCLPASDLPITGAGHHAGWGLRMGIGSGGSEPGGRLSGWPPAPVAEISFLGDHVVANGSDAFDGYLDQVARLEPDGWVPRETDPARRTRRDDVAGPEPC